MPGDELQEANRAVREGQSKYTFFLLAVAGAAIGFAISRTEGDALGWAQLPLGAAVAAWGVSFYVGCRQLNYVHSALYAKMDFIKVGRMREWSPPARSEAQLDIRDTIKENSNKAIVRGRWQFRLLIIGAVFYIVWHVVEMLLLTGATLETG